MSTKNPNESQKSFSEIQRGLGGITPSLLKVGEIARLVTRKAVYEIQGVDDGKFRCYTVTVDTPSDIWSSAYPDRGVARIMSHHTSLKFDMMDWIGKGMRPVFKMAGGASIMVCSVIGASIIGEDYEYTLWKD